MRPSGRCGRGEQEFEQLGKAPSNGSIAICDDELVVARDPARDDRPPAVRTRFVDDEGKAAGHVVQWEDGEASRICSLRLRPLCAAR